LVVEVEAGAEVVVGVLELELVLEGSPTGEEEEEEEEEKRESTQSFNNSG